jgi:opacity protein-like surface antigen
MKKVLLGLFALFLCATGYADKDYYVYADRGAPSSQVSTNDFNGLYIKIASGLALPSIQFSDVGKPAAMKIPVIGSLGYSHVWNQFYAGLEGQFGWDMTAQKAGYTTDGKNLTNNPKWQTMATVQLGGVISQTNIIYVDGGYALGGFQYINSANLQKTLHINGPTVGVGTSLQLSNHVNFDMNYHFIYYLKKNSADGQFKIKQNLITAGLSLHF